MLRIDVAPIPGHAFYKQTEFEGLFSDDFFQLLGLAAQILDFGAGRRTRCVTGEAAFAGFEELFRPAVVEALGDAFTAAEFGDCGVSAQSIQDDADFLFSRILLAGCPPDIADEPLGRCFRRAGFSSHAPLLRW